ncbi:MAG: TonB-dependent receptor, partial [Haliea sp.]
GLPVDDVRINAISTIDAESYAAYANLNYDFTEQWSLSAGLRYSRDEKDLKYIQIADPLAQAFGFLPLDITDSISDGEWTPAISLSWRPHGDMLVYLSYNRGYKAGGFNNSLSSTASALSFEPETLDSIELGVKSAWLDDRLRLNAALFHMDYQDKQESAFLTGVGFVQSNAGEATSDGFEMDVEFAATEIWRIYAAIGYADARYDEYVVDDFTDYGGNTLVRAPEWTANLGAQAEWRFNAGLTGMFRLDYSWQDAFFTRASNDPFFAADSQSLLNARLRLAAADERWAVTLWGRNLTDDDNINTKDGASNFFFPTYHYSLIAPRTYGVELLLSF